MRAKNTPLNALIRANIRTSVRLYVVAGMEDFFRLAGLDKWSAVSDKWPVG
jgi:hypothetical protein